MQQFNIPSAAVAPVPGRIPEARYAYYRRCQVFRKGGQQCKAPAEKGSHICHAHAGQLAMAVRRQWDLRAVLEEAVAQMRRRGRPECEMADLFMDFKGINMTLAVMAKAVITGRIDCKTAGQLVLQLQTFSKLLWQIHRKGREGRIESQLSSQISADDRRLEKEKALTTKVTKEHEGRKTLPLINTDNTDLRKTADDAGPPQIYDDERRLGRPKKNLNLTAEARRRGVQPKMESDLAANHVASNHVEANHLAANHLTANQGAANEHDETRIALVAKVLAIADGRGWAHAPPELLRAA